jgi:hypothetical protein
MWDAAAGLSITVDTALKWLGAIVFLAGFLVTIYIFFRRDLQHRTADIWEKTADALQARVDVLEHELEISRANEAAVRQQLATAEGSIRTLQDVVSGRAAIEALTDLMRKNHQETTALLRKVTNERRG